MEGPPIAHHPNQPMVISLGRLRVLLYEIYSLLLYWFEGGRGGRDLA